MVGIPSTIRDTLPDAPLFDEGRGDDRLGCFFAAFKTMCGTVLDLAAGDPLAEVKPKLAGAKIVVPLVPEIAGMRTLDPDLPPADVDIAIVRSVAETGSIALTERKLGINTLGYLAQHLIVLLDPDDIVVNIHHAYQWPEFPRHGLACSTPSRPSPPISRACSSTGRLACARCRSCRCFGAASCVTRPRRRAAS